MFDSSSMFGIASAQNLLFSISLLALSDLLLIQYFCKTEVLMWSTVSLFSVFFLKKAIHLIHICLNSINCFIDPVGRVDSVPWSMGFSVQATTGHIDGAQEVFFRGHIPNVIVLFSRSIDCCQHNNHTHKHILSFLCISNFLSVI